MLNPLRWTMLTWFALCLWLYGAIPLNIPPSVTYTVNPVTGDLEQPISYDTLQDYPFPIGWPLHYVEPDDPALWTTPISFTGLPIAPGPSRVSYVAAAVNFLLIVVTLTCLVFLLQSYFQSFSTPSLLLFPALLSAYILGARLVAQGIGFNAYWYYATAIYFSPILIAVLHAFGLLPFKRSSAKQVAAFHANG